MRCYLPVIRPCVTMRTGTLLANDEANKPMVANIAPKIPTILSPNLDSSQIHGIALTNEKYIVTY